MVGATRHWAPHRRTRREPADGGSGGGGETRPKGTCTAPRLAFGANRMPVDATPAESWSRNERPAELSGGADANSTAPGLAFADRLRGLPRRQPGVPSGRVDDN